MKRAILTVAAAAALVSFGASAAEVIKLWPNGAPNKSTITEAEYTNEKGAIFNVTEGRMEVTVHKSTISGLQISSNGLAPVFHHHWPRLLI